MVSVDQLRQTVEQHCLADDPEVQQLLQKAIAVETTLDGHRQQRVLQYIKAALDAKVEEKRRHPFPVPDPVNHWQPTVYIGETPANTNMYLPLDDLAQHLGVFAQSKGGKTTFFRNLMIQLDQLQTDVSWWAVDFNRDYRHLATVPGVDVIVFPFQSLRFNPLKPPPEVSLETWQTVVAEIFADSQALLDASENFSAHQLQELYQQYKEVADDSLDDLYEQTETEYPTLVDLYNYLDEQGFHPSDPAYSYHSRVQNRLQGIIDDSFYTVDCVHGHDLEALLAENVIFEVHQPRTNIASFFVELLFAWVQEYRIAHNQGDDQLRHIWFKDELKNTHSIYKEKQVDSGVPVISDRFARSRNQGESVFGADQVPTLISEFVLANTYVTMLGPMNDYTQFERIANSMGILDDPHQQQAATNLDVGEFIIQVGSDGPYKVTTPNHGATEDVSDDQLVDMYSEQWQTYLETSSGDLQTVSNPAPSSPRHGEPRDSPPAKSEASERSIETVENELSDAARKLLRDIAQHPFKPVSKRYELFSSTGKGHYVKNEVVDSGLIEELTVADHGTTRKLFEFTELGQKYVDTQDFEIERAGKGGIKHRYWQHRIEEMLEAAGYTAGIEKMEIDVYGKDGDQELAVEVAMGKNQREIDHVEDRHRRGIDRVVVACASDAVKTYLTQKGRDADISLQNVEFQRFHELSPKYFQQL
jgi:hypothetical protein